MIDSICHIYWLIYQSLTANLNFIGYFIVFYFNDWHHLSTVLVNLLTNHCMSTLLVSLSMTNTSNSIICQRYLLVYQWLTAPVSIADYRQDYEDEIGTVR